MVGECNTGFCANSDMCGLGAKLHANLDSTYGARSLSGPLNPFHLFTFCEYADIEVFFGDRHTEGEGVEAVRIVGSPHSSCNQPNKETRESSRHVRILDGRLRGSGLPGLIARLISLFAGVSAVRDYVEVQVAGQTIVVERVMPSGSPPHEITVVLPHVEIRRIRDSDRPEKEVYEVILDSITVVSSPVRPVAQ